MTVGFMGLGAGLQSQVDTLVAVPKPWFPLITTAPKWIYRTYLWLLFLVSPQSDTGLMLKNRGCRDSRAIVCALYVNVLLRPNPVQSTHTILVDGPEQDVQAQYRHRYVLLMIINIWGPTAS